MKVYFEDIEKELNNKNYIKAVELIDWYGWDDFMSYIRTDKFFNESQRLEITINLIDVIKGI
jgi:hypothetical protein